MKKKLNLIHASVVCLFAASCGTAEEPSAQQPNIIIIYADDLGYGDVQSYNPDRGKIPTPNIDRLAGEPCRIIPGLQGTVKVSGSRNVNLKEVEPGVFTLDLKRGEEAILWSGDHMPEITISPLPGNTANVNSFGINEHGL